jgi:hypothetical protein
MFRNQEARLIVCNGEKRINSIRLVAMALCRRAVATALCRRAGASAINASTQRGGYSVIKSFTNTCGFAELAASENLRETGRIPTIRYPTVAKGIGAIAHHRDCLPRERSNPLLCEAIKRNWL